MHQVYIPYSNHISAATQRYLSPQDTDLIELTLTTIFDIDKLLHLLRDRSDNLDLLGTRLKWEDLRIGAWIDRRALLDDVAHFLQTRARWSSEAYETTEGFTPPSESLVIQERSLKRRGSVASLASVVSTDATSLAFGISRAARFSMAEKLSREGAKLGARVMALKNNKVATSGKMLDKLIDDSRKPIPDELLDEQDKVEEKCISELEKVGAFIMSVVLQWRKYVAPQIAHER